PEVVKLLIGKGLDVTIEPGAGHNAGFLDDDYRAAGATIAPSVNDAIEGAAVVLRVNGPTDFEAWADRLKTGQILIAFLFPTTNPAATQKLAKQGVSSFAMELIPRITRAQSMDALSSMSTIAGYKGALLAADSIGKFFPTFMTAAGTLAP